MVSRPGSEPAPAWLNNLHWAHAGAFHVEWLNKSETHFRKVWHLVNEYNGGRTVIIGKDGQEIEERCGEELVRLLDLEAMREGGDVLDVKKEEVED